MPTAVIVDDEPLLRAQLRDSLRSLWPELSIVAEADHGEQAVERIKEKRPDFAFLDIEMPGVSGLEVAAQIKGGTHIVFVTAYDQYAIEAFDRGAIDYLLKPASSERLKETVARLRARTDLAQPQLADVLASIQRTLAGDMTSGRLKWIQASLGSQIRMIAVDDVIFFQSDSKYTKVRTKEGESLIRLSLKELLDQLDSDQFWQIHRSTIVNVKSIGIVTRDELGHVEIALKDCEDTLEVSRSYAHLFKAL